MTIYCVTIVSQACRFFESVYDPVLVPSHNALGEPESNGTSGYDDAGTGNDTQLVLGCRTHFAWWVAKHENTYFNIYYWFRVVFIHLVPCSTLVTVNAALVRAMRAASHRRKQLLSHGGGQSAAHQPMQQRRKSECRRLADSNVTTAMLVAVVGVFLLVEFPLAVLFILVIVENSFQLPLIDPDVGETASMFINLMILFSYSTNFFIYCGMSAQFRSTLIEMLTGGSGSSRRSGGHVGVRLTRTTIASEPTTITAIGRPTKVNHRTTTTTNWADVSDVDGNGDGDICSLSARYESMTAASSSGNNQNDVGHRHRNGIALTATTGNNQYDHGDKPAVDNDDRHTSADDETLV